MPYIMEKHLPAARGSGGQSADSIISPSPPNQPKIRTLPSVHSSVAVSARSTPQYYRVPAHPVPPKRESTLLPSGAIHRDSRETETPASSPDAAQPHKSKTVAGNPCAVEPITPPTSVES